MKPNRKILQFGTCLLLMAVLSAYQNCAPSGGFSSEVSNLSSTNGQQQDTPGNSPMPSPTPEPAPVPMPAPAPSPVPTPLPPPEPQTAPPPTPSPEPSVVITYYIDASHPMASDTNSGKSKDTPWKSLAAVNSKSFQPGDVIGFKRGTTYSGGLVLKSSGTSAKPLLVTSYGEGPDPVFTNSGKWSQSITIEGSYVVLEKVKVTGAYESGVRLSNTATNDTVREIEATDVGVGVQILGSNNRIHHVYAHDLKMVTNTVGGDDDWGANGFIISGPNNELSFNRCLRCLAPSYDYGTDGGMFELYGNTDNSFIHHNICIDSDGLFEVGGSTGASAKNIRIAYNEVLNSRFGGIHASGNFATVVSNFHVENNTVVDTQVRSPSVYALFWIGGTLPQEAVVFRNNLVSVRSFQNVFQQQITRLNNFYQLLSPSTGLVGGARSLASGEAIGDPLFVSPANSDFHLQPSSPSLDKGVPLGYTMDLDGKPVSGTHPDLGAYED